MPLLYLHIEKYKTSELKAIARFAIGLEKDLDAVENSVASVLLNGFVEGTNSKLKMVKRTMYGRCSKLLLATKLMYAAEPALTDNYGRTKEPRNTQPWEWSWVNIAFASIDMLRSIIPMRLKK